MNAPDHLTKLRDPGWTPGRKDVAALLALLGTVSDEDADAIVRRLEPLAPLEPVVAAHAAAPAKSGHRYVVLLGRIARREPLAIDAVVAALEKGDPQSRKAAARALGKLPKNVQNARIEDALLAAFGTEQRPEVRRALVEALGRAGGEKSRAALAASADEGGDALTKTMRARAELVLERSLERGASDADKIVVPERATVVLRCREGLEELLRLELGERAFVAKPGEVRVPIRRGAAELMAARLWTSVTIPIEAKGQVLPGADVAGVIADCLRVSKAQLLPWTGGLFRFRLDFRDAGHRRAVAFRVAELVSSEGWLRNDPKESPWEIEVTEKGQSLRLVAIAKKLPDERFAWRVADVPAASHPTIAAALALTAGVEPGDVVWDPFVGSGLELIERARLGGTTSLLGTDLDPAALEAAKKNLDAAAIDATLTLADASTFTPPARPTLIVTNPPMGRRVQTAEGEAPARAGLDAFLTAFLENATRVLAPGGRLVWLTPKPRTTDPILTAKGFTLASRQLVDMGGFTAELQKWQAREARGRRGR